MVSLSLSLSLFFVVLLLLFLLLLLLSYSFSWGVLGLREVYIGQAAVALGRLAIGGPDLDHGPLCAALSSFRIHG